MHLASYPLTIWCIPGAAVTILRLQHASGARWGRLMTVTTAPASSSAASGNKGASKNQGFFTWTATAFPLACFEVWELLYEQAVWGRDSQLIYIVSHGYQLNTLRAESVLHLWNIRHGENTLNRAENCLAALCNKRAGNAGRLKVSVGIIARSWTDIWRPIQGVSNRSCQIQARLR